MHRSLIIALLTSALTTGSVAIGQAYYLPPIPTNSPPQCAVEARWTGHKSFLGQYLIEISLPNECPLYAGRLTRIRTSQGGIIPPVGYFRLGGGFPRKIRYYIMPPRGGIFPAVEDRAGPNDWREVEIRFAPWVGAS